MKLLEKTEVWQQGKFKIISAVNGDDAF